MAGTTFKCPNCGAYLTFDPETQLWKCPFCSSGFSEAELLQKDDEYQKEAQTQEPETVPTADGAQVVYRCPSCGSEIVTDETTVATQCYYCHSPVVLQGKLTNDMRPDKVLPFSIDKDKAIQTFLAWAKTKKYIPNAFFQEAQLQTMSGVYYPHFVTECQVDGSVEGQASNSHVMDSGKYIVTTTEHYHVRRDGRFTFRNIMRPALSKANRKLSDGIHPFPLEKAKPFSGAYLSGFLAERRDIDADSIREDVEKEVAEYVTPMLRDTLSYESTQVNSSSKVRGMKTQYVLLPTWVLTYPNKSNPEEPYYYALNGCTGEVCGKLPIDKRKLRRKAFLVGAIVFVLMCLAGYFLY